MQYTTHLRTVWVVMDERIRDELTKNFYLGWNDQEEHITEFTRRLDDKQAKLQSDGLVINDVDELQHYMLHMWDCSLFDQLPMTEWTIKPDRNKSYNDAVTFFNKKATNLEAYKAASGNKNSFESINAAVEITEMLNSHKATNKAAATALLQHDEEQALAIQGIQEEMSTQTDNSTKQLRSDIDKLTALIQTMAAGPSKKRCQTGKAVRFKEDLDSESEDDLPSTPPLKKKKNRQTFNNRNKKWEVGQRWKPGMFADDAWELTTKRVFWKAKKEYRVANPVWTQKDWIATCKKRLAKAREPLAKK